MATINRLSNGGDMGKKECPSHGLLNQLAAGVLGGEAADEILHHLPGCPDCTAFLKQALDDIGSDAPPAPEIQRRLASNRSRQQYRIAREIVARRAQNASQSKPESLSPFVPRLRRLTLWAALALILAGLGVAVIFKLRSPSVPSLLAEAYARKRTLDLRIPGAVYGPIQIQRGAGHTQHDTPAALLEAELKIKRDLNREPENPEILREQAEADLLNGDYQLAMETLGHASRIPHSSPLLFVDLGIAYFERAETDGSPADYETALHHLEEAIRLAPHNRDALFNRAVVYERLFLYDPAIADWEELLALENDPGWRGEEAMRLQELRRKKQRGLSRTGFPDSLRASRLQQVLDKGEDQGEVDAEQYLLMAEREILPGISRLSDDDTHYHLAKLIARHLERAHGDRFVSDLLRDAAAPGFKEATSLLAKASRENEAGHSERAYAFAWRSASLFQRVASPAGTLAAKFEGAYALHFQTRATACAAMARQVFLGARQHDYPWLQIQALLENASCAWMNNDRGSAKIMVESALQIAQSHRYQGFYLRGLLFLADYEAESGDAARAWLSIRQGLQLFWAGGFPPMRGYSFYWLLDKLAEHLGHDNVELAAASQALIFISGGPNHTMEAAERSRLATVALRLGKTKIAEEQFAKAGQLFSLMPQTNSLRWRRVEAEILRVKATSARDGLRSDSLPALRALLPEVERLSNRDLDFQYFSTLAEMQWRAGDRAGAGSSLNTAIALAEGGLKSLSTWADRLSWMNQHRDAYLLLTELLFRSGQEQAALETWNKFLTLPRRDLQGKFDSRQRITVADQGSLSFTRLTYAMGTDGVMLWAEAPGAMHSVYVPVPADHLKRAAQDFLQECSQPNSDLKLLRNDAQELYAWLIAPAKRWLPPAGSIIIQPDGILNILPMEALVDEDGSYLGEHYSLAIDLLGNQNRVTPAPLLVRSSDHLLIVAAANAPGQVPDPQASRETQRIAEKFTAPEVLSGKAATVAALKKEIGAASIFHFAGHATIDREGAAMVMADGVFGTKATGRPALRALEPWSERPPLENVKLAVLSACATATPNEALPAQSLVSELGQAGVPWVTASRWNVDSAATTSFMTSFYDALLSGHAVDRALQLAEEEVRKSQGRAHPYFWAAFGAFVRS